MAEPLALVAVVSSIVQLVDFSSRVLARLNEYHSTSSERPRVFRDLSTNLPVLLDALQNIEAAIDNGNSGARSQIVLEPVLHSCEAQVKLLNDILDKTMISPKDSWTKKSRRAISSIRYESKIEIISKALHGHMQVLTFHGSSLSNAKQAQVPFRRDPDFIDCPALAQLESKTNKDSARVALLGLGGTGKSQLAIEYSYRVRDSLPDIWVFWLHATSRVRFETDYRDIAQRVHIPGWDQPDANVTRLVHNWLCDMSNGHWVVIVDNADDPAIFKRDESKTEPKAPDLLDLLPQSAHGSIVVTARSREAAFLITGSYADIIEVGTMDQLHALDLLKKKLDGVGTIVSDEDALKLVEVLDYLPLAITQAATYIYQRAPRMTLARYLENFEKNDGERTKLLQNDINDSRRDRSASNSIMTTWQTSFEHIRENQPSATDLLSLMSFFDRQAIPAILLSGRYQKDPDPQHSFDEDIDILLSFSLLKVDATGDLFDMHRLVQLSTRNWLETKEQHEKWHAEAVDLIGTTFPDPEFENWGMCNSLAPHAEFIVSSWPSGLDHTLAWALIMLKLGWYDDEMGRIPSAVYKARAALKVRERLLGTNHPLYIECTESLALSLWRQGIHPESEQLNRTALQWNMARHGQNDIRTIKSANRLAISLRVQAKFNESEEMSRQALTAAEATLGVDDPYTLLIVNNFAFLFLARGEYEEAVKLNNRALEARRNVLGNDHPLTLASLQNLARVRYRQGNLEQAEIMCREAWHGKKLKMGESHRAALISACELASVLTERGKYAEAESLMQRYLPPLEKLLGKEHPTTITVCLTKGILLKHRGRLDEAEDWLKRAMLAAEKTHGLNHPVALSSFHELALVCEYKGQLEQARDLLTRAKHERLKVLGLGHPDTVSSIEALDAILARSQPWSTDEYSTHTRQLSN